MCSVTRYNSLRGGQQKSAPFEKWLANGKVAVDDLPPFRSAARSRRHLRASCAAANLTHVKHHYVPQFLLRRWCNDKGKLQSFSVRNGRVLHSSLAPRYTGYENALYAVVANALGIDEDHLERKLFSPIDANAAVALGKIERREVISEADKIAWAFFLNSLRVRQPDVLAHLRSEGLKMLSGLLAEGDTTLPAGALSTEEWLNRNLPGMLEVQSLVSWVPRIVMHDEMTDRFANLNWWVLEFTPEAPKLLLSDLPIHWEGGLNTDNFFIHMPIAPDRLFIGTASEATEQLLDGLPRAELIRRVNRTSLASSSARIWGADADEGRAFIEANVDIVSANVEPFNAVAERFQARKHT